MAQPPKRSARRSAALLRSAIVVGTLALLPFGFLGAERNIVRVIDGDTIDEVVSEKVTHRLAQLLGAYRVLR